MSENRTPRELQTRDRTARKRAWQRPELLPSPNPEPGYEFRWIRLSTMGEADPTNVSAKLREGWEPVKASDHPEVFAMEADNPRFKDNILVGGLMLCKAPVEMVQERNEYYREQAEAQMTSVDHNFMRENDARMPLFRERQTKVTFGRGN
jgi:hypothetical protein